MKVNFGLLWSSWAYLGAGSRRFLLWEPSWSSRAREERPVCGDGGELSSGWSRPGMELTSECLLESLKSLRARVCRGRVEPRLLDFLSVTASARRQQGGKAAVSRVCGSSASSSGFKQPDQCTAVKLGGHLENAVYLFEMLPTFTLL